MQKIALFIVLAMSLSFLAGCLQQSSTPTPSAANLSAAIQEAGRLIELTDKRNLTLRDLDNLTILVDNYPIINDDLDGAKYFITHEENIHVEHELGSIHFYLLNNKTYFCPADEANHIAIYIKYNDLPLADVTGVEFKEQFPPWLEKARLARQKVQTAYPQLDTVQGLGFEMIAKLNARNYTGTRALAQQLADTGYC